MIRAVSLAAALWVLLIGGVLAAREVGKAPLRRPPTAITSTGILTRCKAAGEAALADPVCQQAWAASRARFFGRRPS